MQAKDERRTGVRLGAVIVAIAALSAPGVAAVAIAGSLAGLLRQQAARAHRQIEQGLPRPA
jgi:hypothetical protein